MWNKEKKRFLEILKEQENARMKDLEIMHKEVKKNIQENRKIYNKKWKWPHVYRKGNLVEIQRTQFGSGFKLRSKFHGQYKVTKVKFHARYNVKKVGNHEDPINTNTSPDYMKVWAKDW